MQTHLVGIKFPSSSDDLLVKFQTNVSQCKNIIEEPI